LKPVTLRALAGADIDQAIDYLAGHDPASVDRFIAALEQTMRRLGQHPGVGSPRYGAAAGVDGVRAARVGRTERHIFHVELETHVSVIRVLHERRDIPSLLVDEV
jgi:toxin ParE1/3/4